VGSAADTTGRLLEAYGTTWAEEAGITVSDKPSPLFRLLCLSLLLSARISSELGVRAARALADQGWNTPAKLLDSTWAQRAKLLNESGYARFDERTSRMLADTTALVVERWRGDVRRLREEAGRDPATERMLLKGCKGIGDVGVDIFFREVQGVWPEVRPALDDRAMRAARRLGLGDDPRRVGYRVEGPELPRLASALVRVDLDDGYERLAG